MIRTVFSNLLLIKGIRIASLKEQVVGMRGLIGFALSLIASGIIAIVGIAAAFGVPADELTRDPAAVMGVRFYVGLLSNWGIMLWSAAAAMCLFTAWLLRERNSASFAWLLASGLITALLAMDDMFMLHEDVFPNVFGIHEKVVYLIYLLAGGIYILYFLPEFLKRKYLIFAAAFVFLAISVLSDSIGRWFYVPTAVEDSFKYAGIVLWLIFFMKTARDELAALLSKSQPQTSSRKRI
jgi:hypothetical protein